tara:strand:+ start:340 stop:552 length:213 start_codon:yes stop_codon:yes gene_type:complete
MNELGQGFFAGLFTLYVLGVPLLYHMVEPEDPEENNNGPIKFALLWPLIALEVIYRIFVGERDNDGTGTN